MNMRKTFLLLSFSALSVSAFADNHDTASAAADNSKLNQRDRAETELTADQQKLSKRDTQITQRIRQEIMKVQDFSTYAQNVKIITVNGLVTLKGPVRTSAEEERILKLARKVAGPDRVVDEMDIAPKETL